MIYTMLLLIGLLGLLAQTLLGVSHGGPQAGHAHAGPGGHHGHGAHHHGAQGRERGPTALGTILGLFSPLTFFSLCVGVGATGTLLHHLHKPGPLTAILAALGGIAFYGLIVRPLWGVIFQFASKPSEALEGMVARTGEALTRFDAAGRGLVRLTLDGQIVRVLATLEPDDRADASAVQPGDKLTVTAVDGHSNTCRVARL